MLDEHLIPATEAAQCFPTRPCRATLWRWILKGSRGVRLETVLIGGQRFTSREAVARFIGRVTAAAEPAVEVSR